jgi:hypothetical protein
MGIEDEESKEVEWISLYKCVSFSFCNARFG